MRTGAAAGHHGYFHEAAFYDSDEELLRLLVPFYRDGLDANEPCLAAFAPHNQNLLREALGADSGIRFVDGRYLRPASAIRWYRDSLAQYVKDGADQIRVAGDVPHPGTGVPWEWWARYEAAVNYAYDDFPIWGICPYDTRLTPPTVLDEVSLSHPFLATGAAHEANREFRDPAQFPRDRGAHWRDPMESSAPVVDLLDPSAAQARAALAQVAAGCPEITEKDINGLTLSVSEAVSNALLHSRPPVRLRVWAAPHRITVAVNDPGAGPTDPFVGLVPAVRAEPGGLGMWLAHQACSYVSLGHGPEGFTIRLVAGDLSDAAG